MLSVKLKKKKKMRKNKEKKKKKKNWNKNNSKSVLFSIVVFVSSKYSKADILKFTGTG